MNYPRRLVCSFLVPLIGDTSRQPHSLLLWRLLQDKLIKAFGGITGPEPVLYYRSLSPVPGSWLPEESPEPVEDESRRYTVAVPEGQVEQLRSILRKVGNSFDQRAIYLEVKGVVEILEVHPEDGFLGDP